MPNRPPALDDASRTLLTSRFGESDEPEATDSYFKEVDVEPIDYIDYSTQGSEQKPEPNWLRLISLDQELAGRMPEEVICIMDEIKAVRALMSERGYIFEPSSDEEGYVYHLKRPLDPKELRAEIDYLCEELPGKYAEILQRFQKAV